MRKRAHPVMGQQPGIEPGRTRGARRVTVVVGREATTPDPAATAALTAMPARTVAGV
jgi:hypothetical protein